MVTRTPRRRRALCDTSPGDTDGYLSSASSSLDPDEYDDDVFDYESDDSCSTTLTRPEPALEPDVPPRPGRTRPHPASSEAPEYSDDPDDDTDEDLANIPLDYGRSEKTIRRRIQIEERWHQ
jgi:hypothetical protein